MRRVVYQGLLRLPFKLGGAGGWVLGLVGTVWPERVKTAVGDSMTVEAIQQAGILLLALATLYFALLWVLKPGAASQGEEAGPRISGGSGVQENYLHSGSGHQIIKPGAVTINGPRYELTEDELSEVARQLDKSQPVSFAFTNHGRSEQMASQISNYLQAQGFTVKGTISLQMGQYNLPGAVSVWPNGFGRPGIMMNVGGQTVVVDGSLA